MKIIIAGDGKVGSTLTRELAAEGYDVTIIDANPKVLEATEERYDVLAIQGNCASMDVLDQAGVREADLLIVATSADEINLLCSLTAHCMNKRHTYDCPHPKSGVYEPAGKDAGCFCAVHDGQPGTSGSGGN